MLWLSYDWGIEVKVGIEVAWVARDKFNPWTEMFGADAPESAQKTPLSPPLSPTLSLAQAAERPRGVSLIHY